MKFNRNRSGVAAVEFAMTVPLLFLFIFATYELGRANMLMHTTEAAAYEGARVAIIPGASAADAEVATQAILRTAGISSATITVTPANLNTDTDTVAVEVSVGFKANTTVAPLFVGDSPIVRRCQLTREKL